MAVEFGVSAGFCAASPTADPAGSAYAFDNYMFWNKDVAPEGAGLVTEIGFWVDNATEEANFEVGIYSHDAVNDRADSLLAGYSQTNAKGTGAGWKKCTGLSIEITAGQTYWIGLQLDNTATATNYNRTAVVGSRRGQWNGQTTLAADGSNGGASWSDGTLYAVYAVWAAGGGSSIVPILNSYKMRRN